MKTQGCKNVDSLPSVLLYPACRLVVAGADELGIGSVCASRGPAASKPVIKREIGLNIRHETVKRRCCPIRFR